MFQGYSGVVPGCSGGVPGVFRGCSGGVPRMFRGVPGCSGAVPGFTDTQQKHCAQQMILSYLNSNMHTNKSSFTDITQVNKTRNMEHSGTSRNILEHFGTFRNIPEQSKLSQNK